MGAELLRILVDELAADNVRSLIVHQERNNFHGPVPDVTEEPSRPGTTERPGREWFVTRAWRIEIGDGRHCVDRQYLCQGGTWTFDQDAAQAWADRPSDDFILRLRQRPGNQAAQAQFC